MVTINTLMDIEEILLKADSDIRYEYTMGELIKSASYLKEIGSMTSIFFDVQYEYAKTRLPQEMDKEEKKQKLIEYQKWLTDDKLDIDITKYVDFINQSVKPKLKRNEYLELVEKLNDRLK